jgi:hypothetical protein
LSREPYPTILRTNHARFACEPDKSFAASFMIKILPCARNNRINECSLYDLDRQIRPVGEAFGRLSRRWRNILPTESNNLAAMV